MDFIKKHQKRIAGLIAALVVLGAAAFGVTINSETEDTIESVIEKAIPGEGE